MTSIPMSNVAALVAIAKAANVSGDREMEKEARRRLQEEHGITLRFARKGRENA